MLCYNLLIEEPIPYKPMYIDCFVRDSSRLHLTFAPLAFNYLELLLVLYILWQNNKLELELQ